jgi:Tfp pilus assembly protein PilO
METEPGRGEKTMILSEQRKTHLILTVFMGLVGLIMIGFFHFMLGRGMINDYKLKTETMREEVAELKSTLTQIDSIMGQKDEIDKQAETIAKVTRRLPSSNDAPGFLNALVMGLGATRIVQEMVKPTKTMNLALYTEIPYEIKAHGYYHSFGQFLTLIEQNPNRFMRVKELTVTNNPERPSMHYIEMDIATFKFNQSVKGVSHDDL